MMMNSSLQASVKGGKGSKGTVFVPHGFHHPKLTRSKNENGGAKGDRSCAKKRGDEENSILQDIAG